MLKKPQFSISKYLRVFMFLGSQISQILDIRKFIIPTSALIFFTWLHWNNYFAEPLHNFVDFLSKDGHIFGNLVKLQWSINFFESYIFPLFFLLMCLTKMKINKKQIFFMMFLKSFEYFRNWIIKQSLFWWH